MRLLLRSEEHTSELQSPCNLVCVFCLDRKSTRLNSSHLVISYAVFCLKKKKTHLRNSSIPLSSLVTSAGMSGAPNLSATAFKRSAFREFFFFLMIRRPPSSPLFPPTPLFR